MVWRSMNMHQSYMRSAILSPTKSKDHRRQPPVVIEFSKLGYRLLSVQPAISRFTKKLPACPKDERVFRIQRATTSASKSRGARKKMFRHWALGWTAFATIDSLVGAGFLLFPSVGEVPKADRRDFVVTDRLGLGLRQRLRRRRNWNRSWADWRGGIATTAATGITSTIATVAVPTEPIAITTITALVAIILAAEPIAPTAED